MDDDGEEKLRLSKRFSDEGGEVDYKTKAGTAWSHSYLNQKPWHPLSYPNQRRKWIAEQTHAQKERRTEEIAREYAQEQEFFRQTALVSKKEKEKMEMMKAVSFMYIRPPGYNAESAKAAEISDEKKKLEQDSRTQDTSVDGTSTSMPSELMPSKDRLPQEKKKPRPKDVFGRALPTEEQFEVLKNAPRLDTGVPARSKPFGVEIRNVKCVRCGNFGHQSGDRECPLKDAIMPNEESRLKRDDPLTAIQAHADPSEPLKWELKQKPGVSPPRGGFRPDDPNQQIVAEDIFDEYGGFLGEDSIPDLLTKVSSSMPKKKKSKRKHKQRSSSTAGYKSSDYKDYRTSSSDDRRRSDKRKCSRKKQRHARTSSSEDTDHDRHRKHRGRHGSRHRHSSVNTSKISDSDGQRKSKHRGRRRSSSVSSSENSDFDGQRRSKRKGTHERPNVCLSEDSDSDGQRRSKHRARWRQSNASSSENSDSDGQRRSKHHWCH